MDCLYSNGVIAVREKYLLGERLKRLCEGSADEAFRQLTEYGFGAGADALSSRDFEALIAAEEKITDDFIMRYAPSVAVRDYLLLPRDFHNAEALVKAEYLSLDVTKMLAPEGNYTVALLTNAVQSGDYSKTGDLGDTVKEAVALFSDEDKKPTGAEIGALFVRGLYRALHRSCRKNRAVAAILARKADMVNLLTAFRSDNAKDAEKCYVAGGKLSEQDLARVFGDAERCERAFARTDYAAFVQACFEARRAGMPYTRAERMAAHCEIDDLSCRRFDLNGSEAFLYYVFRRRLECEDVRILFVCLHAGLKEAEIKGRLRSLREGL